MPITPQASLETGRPGGLGNEVIGRGMLSYLK